MAAEEKLRDEIVALQSSQRDLLKWKLILIGSVSAVGLGLPRYGDPNFKFVLCIIPFLAAYCDLLCRDYDIRIALIGFFLAKSGADVFSKYEEYIGSLRVQSSRT